MEDEHKEELDGEDSTEEEIPETTDEGASTEEPEVDDEGNVVEDPEPKLEPWQVEDSKGVPTSTHIHMKQKLKGRISEKDSKIEVLEAEVAALKKGSAKPNDVNGPVRPRMIDFNSEEAYLAAVETYEEKREDARYTRLEQGRETKNRQHQVREKISQAIDEHYNRAGQLIADSGIDADVYKQADVVVREAVEAIRPNQGDTIVDQLIALTGEGSEKVFYFFGKNKAALAEVKSRLAEDPSGMKAALYIGQQKERLLNPKRRTTKAPAPGPNPNGDVSVQGSKKITALKKRYLKAHKTGDMQTAYNLKKEARKLGAKIAEWQKEI